MELKSKIKSLLAEILKKEFSVSSLNFLVESPKDTANGDYSSNIALVAYKVLSSKYKVYRSPLELAEKIVKMLNTKYLIPNTDHIDAVKPGFINFYLSKEYLISQLGKTPLRPAVRGFAGRKIMVEFTDPNPFKEFHIGHLYTNAIGESVSRLLESVGADVKRANYQGDIGLHVAKAMWGLLQKSDVKTLDKKTLKEKIKILGETYAFGAKEYEVSEKAKKEIEELNKKIYAKEPNLMPLYEKGRQWSLEYFETLYKRLGTEFDYYFFESEVGVNGLKIVKEFLEKRIFEKSQGAVIFPGKKYGLHDRVFINSQGLPTYEAKDIGLAFAKYEKFKFDESISVTGNEIIGYFKVLIMALSKIDADLASKIKHLPHGMVRLPTGKMSSRTGDVITGEWFLEETKKYLKNKFAEMTEDTLEKVTIGAVKYALLKSSIGHNLEFNFEESTNMQGDSGPYLQYTYARTQSVLRKSQISNLKSQISVKDLSLELEEVSLLRALNNFSSVVGQAAEKFAPNLLCNYLFDLASKFNLFYQKCKIIGSKEQNFRLELTRGVGQVIKNGLNLLGIQAPEKM